MRACRRAGWICGGCHFVPMWSEIRLQLELLVFDVLCHGGLMVSTCHLITLLAGLRCFYVSELSFVHQLLLFVEVCTVTQRFLFVAYVESYAGNATPSDPY
ncbi:hypothetical protein BRADI_2g25755v3 [Brachypodium distachyon]|uniref:Uncharacterized protein n=1 Tax=Brachypodium distachyon TaxID=15368 RepID=A0A0Q3QYV0_BRADI|nr:hypothetical protein BRADI_2g25755v3 [Brachypodium distachyon]